MQSEDDILNDCEHVLCRYHSREPGAQIQVPLAPCSPFSVSDSVMRQSAELAQRYNCGLHTHLAGTSDENAFCEAHYGCKPIDLLERSGWLQARTSLAHGIHFKPEGCATMGRYSLGVCHCPTSNAMLASSFYPTAALEQAVSPIGLGVDGSASNDDSNMVEEVRHTLMVTACTMNQPAQSPI